MIELLKKAELDLPKLLLNPELWNSLDVDYFPPRVERLWLKYDQNHRLYIHITHPTKEECLLHKHRWPAAFKMVDGCYELGMTYSKDEIASKEAYKLPIHIHIISAGSYYEMINTNDMHYVKPLGNERSITLMMSGALFPEADTRKEIVDKKLYPLFDVRKKAILLLLQKHYPYINSFYDRQG